MSDAAARLIDGVASQVARTLRACVALPPLLDIFKLPVVLLGLGALRLWPLRGFRPAIITDDGLQLTGAPHGTTLNTAVLLRGAFEPGLSRLLGQVLREGDLCIDAGANVGYFSLLMARAVGASGRVVAIEASPRNVSHLHANLAHNGLVERVDVVSAACTDAPGEVTFYLHAFNDMHCRLAPPGPGELDRWLMGGARAWRPVRVRGDTLAGLVGERLCDAAFVKLDVEGAEPQLVDELTARCHHPRLMVALEAKAPHVEATLRPFERAGFHLYDLRNDYRWLLNRRVPLPRPCTYEEARRSRYMIDVLACREPLPRALCSSAPR